MIKKGLTTVSYYRMVLYNLLPSGHQLGNGMINRLILLVIRLDKYWDSRRIGRSITEMAIPELAEIDSK